MTGLSSDPVMVELVDQEAVAYFVKRLQEIHYRAICLFPFVQVYGNVVNEFYKLGFAGKAKAETML